MNDWVPLGKHPAGPRRAVVEQGCVPIARDVACKDISPYSFALSERCRRCVRCGQQRDMDAIEERACSAALEVEDDEEEGRSAGSHLAEAATAGRQVRVLRSHRVNVAPLTFDIRCI